MVEKQRDQREKSVSESYIIKGERTIHSWGFEMEKGDSNGAKTKDDPL